MERRLLPGVFVVFVLGVFSSTAVALPPMGPPCATLNQGQFSVGFDYGYSEMDVEVSGPIGANKDAEIEDFESNMYLATLAYGISNEWEVFTRLGMADAEFDADSTPAGGSDFDGGSEFAFAVGTKRTLADDGNVKWGCLFQFLWSEADDKTDPNTSTGFGNGALTVPGGTKIDMDWYEIQLAMGPTFQVAEGVSLYGGPFLYFMEGDAEAGPISSQEEIELEQVSEFGGYVGGVVDLSDLMANATLHGEVQFTSDAFAFAIGANIPIP
jgi:hypothetical protein